MDDLVFETRRFDELGAAGLYEVLALRADVFVVEQQCAYQDVDGRDPTAIHLLGRQQGVLVAYARWYENAAGECQIGRIATARPARGQGAGRGLMRAALERLPARVVMDAQAYLLDFYRGFGFEAVGRPFLEDGIEHVRMVRDGGEA